MPPGTGTRKYAATGPAASNPKRIVLLLLQKVSIVFFTGVFLPRGPGGYLSPEGAKNPYVSIVLRISSLFVSRGTGKFLTIHIVKNNPDAKYAAGQGPPAMSLIAATISDGSMRTV